jgi:hypothetical protein
MIEKRLFLEPGDKVRVTSNRADFIEDRPDEIYLIATKGSLGTVVSSEEYRAYYAKQIFGELTGDLTPWESYLASIQWTADRWFRYPIRFDKVEPTTNAEAVVCCREGKMESLDIYVLEKLNLIDETTLFTVNDVRALLPAGGAPVTPPPGHKLLRVGFTIECNDAGRLSTLPRLRVQLAYPGAESLGGAHIPPLRLDLPDAPAVSPFTCTALFRVPERTTAYDFTLQIPARPAQTTRLKIRCLLPSDQVRLVEDTSVHYHDPAHSQHDETDLRHLVFPLATRGSIGVIVTFPEYQASYEQRLKHKRWPGGKAMTPADEAAHKKILAGIREEIETGVRYAVRFMQVVGSRPQPGLFSKYGVCRAGEIYLIDYSALEKV